MKPTESKVVYTGCSSEQVKWGSNDNPNNILIIGKEYTVKSIDIHSWHTKIELKEFPGKFFNNVCFKRVK